MIESRNSDRLAVQFFFMEAAFSICGIVITEHTVRLKFVTECNGIEVLLNELEKNFVSHLGTCHGCTDESTFAKSVSTCYYIAKSRNILLDLLRLTCSCESFRICIRDELKCCYIILTLNTVTVTVVSTLLDNTYNGLIERAAPLRCERSAESCPNTRLEDLITKTVDLS